MKRLLLLVLLACCLGCTKMPPNVTPAQANLYKANDAVVAIGTLQHAAIELNKQHVCEPPPCRPVLSEANTRIVVQATTDTLTIMGPTPLTWQSSATAMLKIIESRLDAAGKTSLLPYINALQAVLGLIRIGENDGTINRRALGRNYAARVGLDQVMASAHGRNATADRRGIAGRLQRESGEVFA